MNEDFVSFDLAKKLKEKRFREECLCHYIGVDLVYNIESPIANNQLWFCHNKFDNIWHRDNVDAPTISQVLKWLRDKNAIFVHISIYSKGWYCDVYTYEYYEEDREYGAKHIVQLDEFSTYEEAALAGIEYALDNVI